MMFAEFGGLRVPVISYDPIKKMEMWWNYFPRVSLTPFEGYDKNRNKCNLGKMPDIFDGCISSIGNEYYLDIPKMAFMEISAPLFPSSWFVESNKKGGLKKTIEIELGKMKAAGKRTDIIKLFIGEEDEKFAAELNKFLDVKDRIVPGVTITEDFLKNEFSCSYSTETKNNNKIENKFIWNFSCFVFLHEVDSVDDAFCYYAHKNCTLYLFGADFIKFKEHPADWSIINAENQTLPVYLSKDKEKCKGLANEFEGINAGDFVWKNTGSDMWTETESKEHLLGLFRLEETINVNLKNIYNSFCLPLLQENDYTKISNKDPFIAFKEYGWKIIENTLLRKTYLTGGQIQNYTIAWVEIINNILEGTPRGTSKYCPTKFETFIKQAAGQANYCKEWTIKHAAGEYGPFEPEECQLINDYFREIYGIITSVPREDQEKFFRIINDGGIIEKLKEIIRLVTLFESIKTVFKNRYGTIIGLYNKAFPYRIDRERENKDGEVFSCPLEDEKQLTPEQRLINEERKKIIIRWVNIRFAGDIEWIGQLRDEPASSLWSLIRPYKPNSTGRLTGAGPDTNLYRLYKEISIIKKNHTDFQHIMRDIADVLELKGYWE
jgi:hypothetical protein